MRVEAGAGLYAAESAVGFFDLAPSGGEGLQAANPLADLLYAALNPRNRLGE